MSKTDPRPATGLASRRRVLLGALAAGFAMAPAVALAAEAQKACDEDPKCLDRQARGYLNLGDAEAAVDEIEKARVQWELAVKVGTPVGSQAADTARTRLQMYMVTCLPNKENLPRLSTAEGRRLVSRKTQQSALTVLGYYQGPIDGDLSVPTRNAIRKFQNDMSFSETDDLQSRQKVYLVCNAAATARDPSAQTTLGLMYAGGFGVARSIKFALAWLRSASSRGHGEGSLYLALLLGTGRCGFPLAQDNATQYLKDACRQKHPVAIELVKRYGGDPDQASRWARIGADPTVNKCLEIIGKDCGGTAKPQDSATVR
jgi:TPR repeat protein